MNGKRGEREGVLSRVSVSVRTLGPTRTNGGGDGFRFEYIGQKTTGRSEHDLGQTPSVHLSTSCSSEVLGV